MTRTAPRQSSETTHARRHVTCVVAHRADGLTDRLLAFGDRVEIAHDYSDREAEAEGLDCLERPHAPTMSRARRSKRPSRPTAVAASSGNVVLFCGGGNHVDLRGLPGGAEGIRTLGPPQTICIDSFATDRPRVAPIRRHRSPARTQTLDISANDRKVNRLISAYNPGTR